MSGPSAILASVAAVSLVLTALEHACLRRLLARRRPTAGPTPPVSVLKPLKGLDDGLYENLVSFARQRYPAFELVFGTPDRNDPAIAVVERVAAEFPQVPMSLTVCDRPFGRNPKVRTLADLLGRARHERVLVSDSNVRVEPDYLAATVAEMADPRVGLVCNVIAGGGEATLGSAFETAHLNTFVAAGVAAAAVLGGRTIVIGKSMLFRKRDLAHVGGLRAVRHVLAEDYVLGRRFEAAGFRVAISPHVVTTVVETWTVRRFAERHVRWGQLRRRIAPLAYLGEPLLNPVPWLLAVAAAGAAGGGVGPVAPAGLAAAALGGVLLKAALDGRLVRQLRGRPLAARHLALLPLKDLLVAGAWAVAAVRRRVVWRGTVLRIGRGSRLLRVPGARQVPAPRDRAATRVTS